MKEHKSVAAVDKSKSSNKKRQKSSHLFDKRWKLLIRKRWKDSEAANKLRPLVPGKNIKKELERQERF